MRGGGIGDVILSLILQSIVDIILVAVLVVIIVVLIKARKYYKNNKDSCKNK